MGIYEVQWYYDQTGRFSLFPMHSRPGPNCSKPIVIANAGISINPSSAPLFSLKRGGDVMTFQTTHCYFN